MTTDTRPRLPVTWWGVAVRIIAATLLTILANMARIPAHDLAAEHVADGTNHELLATTVIFLLTPVIVIGAVVAWLRWVERASISVTGLTRWRTLLPGMAGGITLAGLAVGAAWLLLVALGRGQSDVPAIETDIEAVSPGLLVVFLVVRAVMLQGLPEELIYRGWLFHVTRRRPWLTLVWTTLAFTVIHLSSAGGQQSTADHLYYLLVPFGMGVLGGAVVLWRGSVWWAVGTHGGLHIWLAVCSAVHPVALDRLAWLLLGIAQLVVGSVILVLWQRGRRRAAARRPHITEFQNP